MTRALLIILALPLLAVLAVWMLAILLAGTAVRVGEKAAGR